MSATRIVEISPLTRVEGHGKVTVHQMKKNRVSEARLHIVEFRALSGSFRAYVLGGTGHCAAPCGICPVSHHLAAARAMDQIVGVDVLPPRQRKNAASHALWADNAK